LLPASGEAAVNSSIGSSTCFPAFSPAGPEGDLQNGDVESMRGCSFFLVHESRPRPGKNGVVAARLLLKMPLESGRFEILPLKRCRIQGNFILTKYE
jgi:hypothetical protein